MSHSPTGGASPLVKAGTAPGGAGAGGESVRATGGTTATGGVGAAPTGGTGIGGAWASGGAATGGASATGGSNTVTMGGSPTGGRSATGGTTTTPTGGASATGGTTTATIGGTNAGGSIGIAGGPCDIYAFGNTPCAAAYSMTRVMYAKYAGPLYQVRKGGTWNYYSGTSGGTVQDIGTLDGYADTSVQDAFCSDSLCTVSVIYDQSGNGNHLTGSLSSCYAGTANVAATESIANGRTLTVSGHKVYGLYTVVGNGYRNNKTTGMPTGNAAQGIYEVIDGQRYGTGCCWDFGNALTNNCDGKVGSTNALFFGVGYWGRGEGTGPWFMADFDTGVWAGSSGAATDANLNNPSVTSAFAMGILKTNAPNYAIRVGDAHSGSLATAYDGQVPFASFSMQGAVILAIDSAVDFNSYGTFFEGAITSGRPSDAIDDAVLKNVQAADYGN